MRARVIVPQHALSEAKSRLGRVLSTRRRAELSLALLRHVCAALLATADVEGIVIMTPDPAVRAHAARWGVPTRPDPGPEFNRALSEVIRATAARLHAVVVVAADLPLLQPADVAALLAAGDHGRLVLAPSKEGTGTNAVVVPPGLTFHAAYGPGSLSAHRRAARALGPEALEIRRPGLAFDLDTESDLLALDGRGGYGVTPAASRPGWR